MANVGTANFPSTTNWPGTSNWPGQGIYPICRCKIAKDDYSVASPKWEEVDNRDFRGFTVSRGRENELQQFDAGTASVILDNRDRAYDPNSVAAIGPMNRVWLYEEWSAEVHDLFKGYVDSWQLRWPDPGMSDAYVEIAATDEFKVLSLDAVPTTDPPRTSYEDLIGVDAPVGYWRLNEDPALFIQETTEPEPNQEPDPRSLGGYLRGRVLGWWPD